MVERRRGRKCGRSLSPFVGSEAQDRHEADPLRSPSSREKSYLPFSLFAAFFSAIVLAGFFLVSFRLFSLLLMGFAPLWLRVLPCLI
jgi:hypothetical protein